MINNFNLTINLMMVDSGEFQFSANHMSQGSPKMANETNIPILDNGLRKVTQFDDLIKI